MSSKQQLLVSSFIFFSWLRAARQKTIMRYLLSVSVLVGSRSRRQYLSYTDCIQATAPQLRAPLSRAVLYSRTGNVTVCT